MSETKKYFHVSTPFKLNSHGALAKRCNSVRGHVLQNSIRMSRKDKQAPTTLELLAIANY